MLGLQTRRGSNHSAAHVGESNSRSNVLQIRREFACVSSRWKVLSGEFRRRPTALAIKFRKLDRVGRRGLFEPGGIFSRLITYAFLWMFPSLNSAITRNCIQNCSPNTLRIANHRPLQIVIDMNTRMLATTLLLLWARR